MTLAHVERRIQKLERTRRSPGRSWIAQWTPPLLLLVFILEQQKAIPLGTSLSLLLMVTIVFASAQLQINGIHRRLDALIELLDPQLRRETSQPDPAPAQPAPHPAPASPPQTGDTRTIE
jgi:hypothetical protein